MGWFWADTAPHPIPSSLSNAEPPPGCPMHKKTPDAPSHPLRPETTPPSPPTTSPPAQTTTSPSYVSKLNPLNYMPTLSNTAEHAEQTIALPLSRETSTIPRGAAAGGGTWEYPSPQQMYNAMLRKGYTDTPAEHVEAMVSVHNFLNEGAWEEIREWERRFSGGLGQGWKWSLMGEEGAERQALLSELRAERDGMGREEPKLLRFEGRPDEPTPKARMMGFMAWVYPSAFADNPPFDRHDWYVERTAGPGGEKKEVRYVIDYYSGPDEASGEPVFFLDVRPAVDGPVAACERLGRWGGDVWWRASGGSVRDELAKKQQGRK